MTLFCFVALLLGLVFGFILLSDKNGSLQCCSAIGILDDI